MKFLIFLLLSLCFFTGCIPKDGSYPSYKKLDSFKLKSFEGNLTQLSHKKSGAQIVLIKNKDQARSFMIAFKTPPYDDTGLFHVFEHAVLAGSRLYPSKSNFNNVSSSSVASFINAMTGSVYTLYPFVTRDSKEFENLLSVYMDAVFFPNAVKNPNIMKREGWRYEILPDTKKMSINGIAFSEMKGHLANPHFLLWRRLSKAFLPQTPYRYSSGGLPDKMSELQFQQIIEAHKKYYRPQNALICLYGDIDFKKTLAVIDKQFLNHFNKNKDFKNPEISRQKDFKDLNLSLLKASYPGPKEKNKDFVSKVYLLDKLSPLEENAISVFLNAFASNNIAPLKLRLIKEKLAKSVSYTILGNYNVLAFVFEGADDSKRKQLGNVLQEELTKVIDQGLDQKLLTSVLNKYEFFEKEKNHNADQKGFFLSWTIVNHWLFPNQSLEKELDTAHQFQELRNLLKDKIFVKKFFQKHFKENTDSHWLVMEPDPLYSQKFNQILEEKVKTALKQKPFSEYEKEYKLYQDWNSEKEAQEITDKTPLLKLSDLTVEEKPIPFNKLKEGSYEIIEYPQRTNEVSYVRLFFDLRGVKEEYLKNLNLFTSLLKKTNTKNYSFTELSKEIDSYIGHISFHINSYQSVKNPEIFKAFLEVHLNFLNENLTKSVELLEELLLQSQFSPKDRVQSLLEEMRVDLSNGISYRAMQLSNQSANKAFFPLQGAFDDEINGGAFLEYFLKSKIDFPQLIPQFQSLLKNIFNQNRLQIVTITTDQNKLKTVKNELKKLVKSLPENNLENQRWSFSQQKQYEAYAIPGEVQFLTETTSFKSQDLEYSGVLKVYAQYLDTYFLHPRIREQAGAYGVWNYFSRNGLWTLSTYRDPNLKKSFETFSQAVNFVKQENLNKEKLKPAILGSLRSYYKDRSAEKKANLMTGLYLSDLTWADYIKTKREILETKPEHFQKINLALEKALQNSKKAVTGKADTIKKEAPFLKEILFLP